MRDFLSLPPPPAHCCSTSTEANRPGRLQTSFWKLLLTADSSFLESGLSPVSDKMPKMDNTKNTLGMYCDLNSCSEKFLPATFPQRPSFKLFYLAQLQDQICNPCTIN